MLFKNFFLYDTDAAEGAGGAATAAATIEPAAAVTTSEAPIIPDDILRELNELRAYKDAITNKEPEKTQEQVAKEAEIEKANFIKFSAENDLMKVDDFNKYETVKSKADRDLVFEDFLDSYKTDNPDTDPEDLLDDAKQAFSLQYHLDSQNKTLRERGEKLLAKEAKDLRNPYDTSFNTAKTRYQEEVSMRQAMPGYQTYMDSEISKNLPDKLEIFTKKVGDQDITVPVEITAEEKKEILAELNDSLKTRDTFNAFMKDTKDGKNERLESHIKDTAEYLVHKKLSQKIYNKVADIFEGIGTKQGSNVGADQPFALVRDISTGGNSDAKDAATQVMESDQKLRQHLKQSRAI